MPFLPDQKNHCQLKRDRIYLLNMSMRSLQSSSSSVTCDRFISQHKETSVCGTSSLLVYLRHLAHGQVISTNWCAGGSRSQKPQDSPLLVLPLAIAGLYIRTTRNSPPQTEIVRFTLYNFIPSSSLLNTQQCFLTQGPPAPPIPSRAPEQGPRAAPHPEGTWCFCSSHLHCCGVGDPYREPTALMESSSNSCGNISGVNSPLILLENPCQADTMY